MGTTGIKTIFLFIVAILLIVASFSGRLGSMLAAFIDASQLQAGGGGA